MKKFFTIFFTVFLLCLTFAGKAQKIDSIYFNLYTDSLKKGVHNYINVVGKLSNGSYLPLMNEDLVFKSSAGKWQGTSLIIDSSYTKESVIVYATLKAQPTITKSVIIYMKKNLTEPPLPTEKEIMEGWKKGKKKS
ncbi:MAG: hypothetical protein LH478_03950 [Chitinophagaceae bacterium]|nr:hypothetical protein [Chitinophagaceae bacterium]